MLKGIFDQKKLEQKFFSAMTGDFEEPKTPGLYQTRMTTLFSLTVKN